MPNRIKGITIEFDGNTTKLDKALQGVNKDLNKTKSALRDVDNLLKLDPKNTDLLKQKQELLGKQVKLTKEKLEEEQKALEQLQNSADSDKTIEQQQALQREIASTKEYLKDAEGAQKDFGSVGAQQIAAVGGKLEEFNSKLATVGDGLTKYVTVPLLALGGVSLAAFNEVDNGADIVVKKTGATGEALDDMTDRMKNLATTIPTDFETAGSAIGEVNTRFGLTGDALEELSGQFIKFADLNDTDVSSSIDSVQKALAAYGLGAEDAGALLDRLNKTGQETGANVDSLASGLVSNAAAFQEMGLGIDESVNLMGQLETSGANSSAVMSGLKRVLKESAEQGVDMSDALAGLQDEILNGTDDMDGLTAAYELFGKQGDQVYNAVKNGSLDFQALGADASDAAGSVSETFENTIDPMDEWKNMLNELKEIGAELGGVLQEVLKPALDKVKEVVDKIKEAWENLTPEQQEQITQIALIVAALGPLILVITKVIGIITTIMNLAPVLGTVIGALTGPLGLVIAAVAAAVAAGIAIYKNWDTIKAKASELWAAIKEKFAAIKDAIVGPITDAKDKIWGLIEKIKGFFSFNFSWPHIPLPHFAISPPGWKIGDILKGSIPSLGIDWYAKAMKNGMILDSPTIFGAMNGRLLGAGEAGSETIVGTNSLMAMIRSAVGGGAGTVVNMTINGAQGQDVNQLANIISVKLQRQVERKGSVWA